jgi:hypothetical protein
LLSPRTPFHQHFKLIYLNERSSSSDTLSWTDECFDLCLCLLLFFCYYILLTTKLLPTRISPLSPHFPFLLLSPKSPIHENSNYLYLNLSFNERSSSSDTLTWTDECFDLCLCLLLFFCYYILLTTKLLPTRITPLSPHLPPHLSFLFSSLTAFRSPTYPISTNLRRSISTPSFLQLLSQYHLHLPPSPSSLHLLLSDHLHLPTHLSIY